jgi:hypothetical protein
MNVFKTLFTHLTFLIVLGGEFFVQTVIIKFGNGKLGSTVLGVAPLTTNQNITCHLLGFGSIIVNLILKKIPVQYFEFVNNNIDLELYNDEEWINRMMKEFDDWWNYFMSFFVDEGDDDESVYSNDFDKVNGSGYNMQY